MLCGQDPLLTPEQAFNILLVVKNFVYFRWANRKADREEMIIEGTPDFRYTY